MAIQSPNTVDNSAAKEPVIEEASAFVRMARMLWADKFALCAAIFLILVIILAIIGPTLLNELATKQNLRGRNLAPFDFSREWFMWLGADALGRPLWPRIIVATQNTIMVAAGAVFISAVVGTLLGLIAGFSSQRTSQIIMRLADVIMSFPSLLVAVIVLYILGSSILNLMLVLSITRIPVYLRTTRAEVMRSAVVCSCRRHVSWARLQSESCSATSCPSFCPRSRPWRRWISLMSCWRKVPYPSSASAFSRLRSPGV